MINRADLSIPEISISNDCGDAASTLDEVDIGNSAGGQDETEARTSLSNPLHYELDSTLTTLPTSVSTNNTQNHDLQIQCNRILLGSPLSSPAADPPNPILEDISVTSGSLSRRRTSSGNSSRQKNTRRLATNSLASTSSNSTITSVSSTSFHARNNSNLSSTINEEVNSGGLRASLDSGMAAVRRWIRSRSTTPGTPVPDGGSVVADYDRSRYTDDLSFGRPEQSGTIGFSDQRQEPLNSGNINDPAIFDAPPTQHSIDGRSLRLSSLTEAELAQNAPAYQNVRQRALSEPDAVRIRDILFQRALYAPQRNLLRRRFPGVTIRQTRSPRRRTRGNSIELSTNGAVAAPSQLSLSAAEVLYSSTHAPPASIDRSGIPINDNNRPETSNFEATENADTGNRRSSSAMESSLSAESDVDPHRDARNRWIRINRSFQFVITIVALVFSLLLFAILVCWVVLTSAYVVSIDKHCDVPLKAYFWLVTLQLILDVFRNDIMRLFLRWDATSTQRIPCRVITYNAAYLIYALLVLRLGIHSVFLNDGTTCSKTAHQLFQACKAFVSLSIAAWSTIILGYLVPFCIVATLLTMNGYSPTSENPRDGTTNPFTMFATEMGAPPGCVDELPIVMLEDFPSDYPIECCICMENFTGSEIIVETACKHVFHKQCCREWLRQARTCPVCRTDIPVGMGTLGDSGQQRRSQAESHHQGPRIGFGPASRHFARNDLHHEMVSLIQIIRRHERRQRSQSRDRGADGEVPRSGTMDLHDFSSSMELGTITRSYA